MAIVEITYRYGTPGATLRPRPLDAESARLRLNEGNRTFAALLEGMAEAGGTVHRVVEIDARDLGIHPTSRGTPGQLPFAAVLGCSDARVPIELIFNEGPNDLFVVRVAGNGLGDDVLGSLRYAVEHLRGSLRLVAVLGHSGCGALTTAVDIFLEPSGYLSLATNHALRSILDRQLIIVQTSARRLANSFGHDVVKHKRYREALTETAIVTNAALTAYAVQQELRGFDPHDLRVVYGVYLLESHEIWAPTRSLTKASGLAEPPVDLASFIELGEEIVGSDRIASLLNR
ncbi:MAG: carbonic anhydrase [Rhodopila sp.]|nr:carbonic anhydrase [Rhodopila sp.]